MSVESESYFIKCGNCGAKNRVPALRMKDRPVCGRCRNPLSTAAAYPGHFISIGDQTFGSEVLAFPGPVVVYVWAPWCGHCRRLTPVLEQMVRDYTGQIKFARMILDQNPLTASRYDIQAVPTLLLYKGGRLVDRIGGALPRADLDRAFQRLV